jgi:hypothetical protein
MILEKKLKDEAAYAIRICPKLMNCKNKLQASAVFSFVNIFKQALVQQ